jgi:ectoine hydroxylase-related dioxygenase (phytanoyl-CoA dioxygenase family)
MGDFAVQLFEVVTGNTGIHVVLYMPIHPPVEELGPDDGGTAVIAGSHKLNCDGDDLVQAAYADPSLIHQVVAPAGSTLLFAETLIHASGPVRSDRERTIIIGGYSHPKSMALYGKQPSGEFLAALPEHLQELIAGKPLWTWPERHRTLGMAADMDDVPYRARMWSVPNA